MTRHMMIEKFLEGSGEKVYERFHSHGRLLPEGLVYLDGWLAKDGACCFQLKETGRYELFEEWTDKWSDLTHFEIVAIGEKPEKGSNKYIY